MREMLKIAQEISQFCDQIVDSILKSYLKAISEIVIENKNYNIIFNEGERVILNDTEKSKTIFNKFIYSIENKNIEILIFDDKSSDNSKKILYDYIFISYSVFLIGFLDDLRININPFKRLVIMVLLLFIFINFLPIKKSLFP